MIQLNGDGGEEVDIEVRYERGLDDQRYHYPHRVFLSISFVDESSFLDLLLFAHSSFVSCQSPANYMANLILISLVSFLHLFIIIFKK